MPELEKAKLTVLDSRTKQPKSGVDPVVVQFNPQTLRVNYRTTGAIGSQTASAQSGQQGNNLQRTGSSAGLSMELLFDTSQTGDDVRNTTLRIAEMIIPPETSPQTANEVPLVQFQWGTFVFSGTIQSMDETLDLFSVDGKPLRSTVSLSMTEVKLERPAPAGGGGGGGGSAGGFGAGLSAGVGVGVSAGISAGVGLSAGAAIGTTPLTLAQGGDSLQGLTARAGLGASWKAVAAANDVDNPRLLQPGAVLNLNVSASAEIG